MEIAGIVSNSISSGALHVATWNRVSNEKRYGKNTIIITELLTNGGNLGLKHDFIHAFTKKINS
jgi:hypothetical protein